MMKKLILALICVLLAVPTMAQKNIYNFKVKAANERMVKLKTIKARYCLLLIRQHSAVSLLNTRLCRNFTILIRRKDSLFLTFHATNSVAKRLVLSARLKLFARETTVLLSLSSIK